MTKEVLNAINNQLKLKIKNKLDKNESFIIWTKDFDNHFIGSVFKPIFNVEKEKIGYLINYTENKEYKKNTKSFFMQFLQLVLYLI